MLAHRIQDPMSAVLRLGETGRDIEQDALAAEQATAFRVGDTAHVLSIAVVGSFHSSFGSIS